MAFRPVLDVLGTLLVFLNNLISIGATKNITADPFPKLGVGGMSLLGLSGMAA